MKALQRLAIIFWQWTWGVLQTLVGFVIFLIHVRKRHIWINGSVITEIPGRWGGISIGMFAFVDYMPIGEAAYQDDTVRHEYGHTIQSMILGPLWVLVIGLPSLIWAGCFDDYRVKHNRSYYWLYTERWADYCGGVKRKI